MDRRPESLSEKQQNARELPSNRQETSRAVQRVTDNNKLGLECHSVFTLKVYRPRLCLLRTQKMSESSKISRVFFFPLLHLLNTHFESGTETGSKEYRNL